jgi:hypothetical protein
LVVVVFAVFLLAQECGSFYLWFLRAASISAASSCRSASGFAGTIWIDFFFRCFGSLRV